jgi:hypothetical protein
MTDLPPAAQAVLDAAQAAYWKHDAECPADAEIIAAAALRAAADQVVPEADYYENCDVVREELLAIADELEGAGVGSIR